MNAYRITVIHAAESATTLVIVQRSHMNNHHGQQIKSDHMDPNSPIRTHEIDIAGREEASDMRIAACSKKRTESSQEPEVLADPWNGEPPFMKLKFKLSRLLARITALYYFSYTLKSRKESELLRWKHSGQNMRSIMSSYNTYGKQHPFPAQFLREIV